MSTARTRTAARTALGVLVAGLALTGCADTGTGADRGRFCGSYATLLAAETGADLHTWVDGMEKAGTPTDLGADATSGLAAVITWATDVPAAADLADVPAPTGQESQIAALGSYAEKHCADELAAQAEQLQQQADREAESYDRQHPRNDG